MLKQLVNRFTAVSIVGVDLGSSWLKVVELGHADNRILLRRCAVTAVEGDDAAALLKRLLSDAGITATHAALGLAAPGVIVRPFQFPLMPKKELMSAIKLESEQAIINGHSSNEMAIDWHTFSSHSQDSVRGLLAVVPKTIVAARLQVAKAAELRPVVVDVEGLALWNAYWALVGTQEPTPNTVLLMNIGASTTNLVIAKGPDELILVRDFQLGAQALTKGQQLEWRDEVRDSLGYARSKGGLRELDSVYVTGGGSGPALIPLLKSVVSAPLTFWNPLDQVARDSESSSIETSVGPLLTIAIGLALRQPS